MKRTDEQIMLLMIDYVQFKEPDDGLNLCISICIVNVMNLVAILLNMFSKVCQNACNNPKPFP